MSFGLNSNEWHSMSDERRSQFMKDKRKLEAFKTEMCKGFIRTGGCRYGMECRFAHDQRELRLRPIHPKYKTELCLNFSKSGHCGYGSRCQFIHRSPDQGRSRSTSTSGHLTNSSYSTVPASMDFYRSLQPPMLHPLNGGVSHVKPSQTDAYFSSRFTTSAYAPRERHPLLQSQPPRSKPPNGDCNFFERENSIDNILSLMRGESTSSGKRVNFADVEEWKTFAADFKKWTPFAGIFGEIPPNSSPTTNGVS